MVEFVSVVLVLWALWVLATCILFVLGVLLVKPRTPTFNGFKVLVPARFAEQLDARELHAVVQHELGHKHHWHVWFNLLRRCCLVPYTADVAARQELEADDYCRDPLALASALRKTSGHPFDRWRADRLEHRQHLAGGMPVYTTLGG